MMPLTGDFGFVGKLKAMARRLEEVPARYSRKLAPLLDADLQRTIDAGTDPNGRPWAPLKESTIRRKGGDARILIRSGISRGLTYIASLGSSGIRMTVGGAYRWHMQPTAHRVARPVLPIYGLPATWRALAVQIGGEEFARALGGRS